MRFGAIDQPSERKLHVVPTPTMGGLAMWVGFLVAIGVSRFLPFFDSMNETAAEPLAAVVTCTLMVGLGVIDDRRGTSALAKLTAQIFIAGILVLLGVQLAYFVLPGEGHRRARDRRGGAAHDPVGRGGRERDQPRGRAGRAGGGDGRDRGRHVLRLPGPRRRHVRRRPRSPRCSPRSPSGSAWGSSRGTSIRRRSSWATPGSMLLGMLVAIATISGVGRNPFPPSRGEVAVIALPLLVPLLVLAIPFLDVLLAIVRRTRKGLGIAHADKEHIFHQLMDIGHGHRRSRAADVPVVGVGLRLGARDRGDRRVTRRRSDRRVRVGALPRDGAAASARAATQRGRERHDGEVRDRSPTRRHRPRGAERPSPRRARHPGPRTSRAPSAAAMSHVKSFTSSTPPAPETASDQRKCTTPRV